MSAHVDIRGERQWEAAVAKAAHVETLHIEGPSSLSLEGIETMHNLRSVTFMLGAPATELWRLAALEGMEEVHVQLGRAPHDVASLLECRLTRLQIDAYTVRRALEVAELPLDRVAGLERLVLKQASAAVLPWPCGWLPGARSLRTLDVAGYVPADGAARAGVRAATQLRAVRWHGEDGGLEEGWDAELRQVLPEADVTGWVWVASGVEQSAPWPAGAVERDGETLAALTLGPDEVAQMRTPPVDASELRAVLARWIPALEARVTIADGPEGIGVESPQWRDLDAIQDLLESGPPEPIEDARLAAFAARFLDEVQRGRIADGDAAVAAWTAGLRQLEADGVDAHEDTAVRDQLYAVLREPLAVIGVDAERVVTAL